MVILRIKTCGLSRPAVTTKTHNCAALNKLRLTKCLPLIYKLPAYRLR